MTLYAPSTPLDTALMFGHWELLIVFLLILIVFGAGKLPSVLSSLGEGVKNFKKSMREDEDGTDKPTGQVEDASPKKLDHDTTPKALTEKTPKSDAEPVVVDAETKDEGKDEGKD